MIRLDNAANIWYNVFYRAFLSSEKRIGAGYFMKKHNNPYVYAGLTALSVIIVTMLLVFIVFRHKELSEGISKITKILQPVFIGAALAYLLAPICNRIKAFSLRVLPESKNREKFAEILGVSLSSTLALAIFVVLILLIVPATYNSIIELIQSVPKYITNLITWINDNPRLKDYPDIRRYVLNLIDTITNKFESVTSIIDLTKSDFLPSIQTMLSSLSNGISVAFSVIINIVIGFIISIYLLSSRATFARQSKMTLYALVKPKAADMIYEEVKFADKMFSGFLRGKMLDSAIVGVICFIVLRLANFPDATLISVIVGVTNIIPVFGPFIGAIPSALLIFVAEPGKTLWFALFILILQQVDGNIIGPKCMGSNVNLSAFWTLFAILFFGGLWGFIGMLIGVPLFAVIYDILKKLIFHNLRRHGKSDMINSNAVPAAEGAGTAVQTETIDIAELSAGNEETVTVTEISEENNEEETTADETPSSEQEKKD